MLCGKAAERRMRVLDGRLLLFLLAHGIREAHGACDITPDGSGHVAIPGGTTVVADSAFEGCSALKTIDFPTSLLSVGKSAFRSTGLTAADLSATSVTEIAEAAFQDSADLATLLVPSSLSILGKKVCRACGALTSIDLSSTTVTSGFVTALLNLITPLKTAFRAIAMSLARLLQHCWGRR